MYAIEGSKFNVFSWRGAQESWPATRPLGRVHTSICSRSPTTSRSRPTPSGLPPHGGLQNPTSSVTLVVLSGHVRAVGIRRSTLSNQVKRLPTRNKMKPSDTWDLSSLYLDDVGWEKDLAKFRRRLSGYEKFRGTLSGSPQQLGGLPQVRCRTRPAWRTTGRLRDAEGLARPVGQRQPGDDGPLSEPRDTCG